MTDVLNCERLRGLLQNHELSDPAKLQKAGFIVRNNTLLCASSKSMQTLWAPGACELSFHAQLDGHDRVSYREYKPITHAEYKRLAVLKEPLTGQFHVIFAWMPLPLKQKETLSVQTPKQSTHTVTPDELTQQLAQLSSHIPSPNQLKESPTEDFLQLQDIFPTQQPKDENTNEPISTSKQEETLTEPQDEDNIQEDIQDNETEDTQETVPLTEPQTSSSKAKKSKTPPVKSSKTTSHTQNKQESN